MKQYNVAVVGATGAVGEKIITFLQKVSFEIASLKVLASKRSAGKELMIQGKTYIVEELTENSFENIDIAFFSAGGSVSEKFVPFAVKAGAVVIDNTSLFRMQKDIPLVVPEVNPEALNTHTGIIANPNCSTIQLVVALEPIRQRFGLNRVIVSTYQAVSGAGLKAIDELKTQTQAFLNGEEVEANILPCASDKKHYPIAFNALPQIDKFTESGYTVEEWKMINETKKIMQDDSLHISTTCVRIPVISGHSESVYIEVGKENVTVEDLKVLLSQAEGVVLQDDITNQVYPTALTSQGKGDTFVGRIRKDVDNPKGFHLWIVSDNLLKGAATNSIQIAEKMIAMNLL